ncbi:alpha/beta fold hydrolase [Mucilaginibacter sp. P25]|uniref:Pimeloyl-ACP methyl ester carboxylesterase n=1 Tax=Mucilaginibacter gossypii TaxID=551996 RepID=A0A1G8BVT2_9SPHI|nr:alpha/beta hydrolase [Mucilaginibacter gossypii]SDH36820.1 Pimeloyl-ACP methyl ester carboxylesterase [Mucilaginibacter gossypii]
MKKTTIYYKNETVNGVNIFYREAGSKENPTILLLNGFPSSSISFRDLINDLAGDYHLVAPDYPAFGNSEVPSRDEYEYTFHNLSVTIEKFIDQIGLKQFSLYAFDYGGPVGFRIAARRPELIQSLIIQNANAYIEGIGPAFGLAMPFLQNRNAETEQPIRGLMTLDGIRIFYFDGAEDPAKINMDGPVMDLYYLTRPGLIDIHLDLLHNYSNNVAEYANWQNYFRTHLPPTLLTWGKNDQFFPLAAAEAYKTDLPHAELHVYNTSHFALEEYHAEIAENIREFLTRNNIR